ncbi:TPA: MFS transporter [Pseudomonas aeruginosa]
MDLRLLLLSLTTFAAGLAESILIGILPPLAEDLRVSISLAGQLTTLFSLGFALAAPLLGWLTRRIERRRLLLATLLLFALSNALAALAPGYLGLLLARLGMSACCGLLIVLASLLAAELAAPAQRGRAIGLIFMGISGSLVFGLIFMGISGSLVFGVPLGVQISDWFGWRWIFAGIAVYSLPLCLLLWRYLPQRQAGDLPGREGYLRQLRQPALWLAQLVSILLLGGHFTLFAYFTPYLASMAGIRSPSEISLILLLIGLAALSGGYIGGWLADRLGHRRALRLVPAAFALALAAVPLSLGSIGFLPVLMVWSAISWMISPVVQSFLLRSDPASGSAGVALNTSAMHLGVGLGAALGGLVVAALGVAATPWVGLALVLAALACALGASTLDGATQALPFSPPAR